MRPSHHALHHRFDDRVGVIEAMIEFFLFDRNADGLGMGIRRSGSGAIVEQRHLAEDFALIDGRVPDRRFAPHVFVDADFSGHHQIGEVATTTFLEDDQLSRRRPRSRWKPSSRFCSRRISPVPVYFAS